MRRRRFSFLDPAMARRQPSRRFSCCEHLPARSPIVSRFIGGLLLVSLLAVQVPSAAWWLPSAFRLTAAVEPALTVADGAEWNAEAIPPIAERRSHRKGFPEQVKAVDLALDPLLSSRPARSAFCVIEPDRHAKLRRTGTLVDLHVRLQI